MYLKNSHQKSLQIEKYFSRALLRLCTFLICIYRHKIPNRFVWQFIYLFRISRLKIEQFAHKIKSHHAFCTVFLQWMGHRRVTPQSKLYIPCTTIKTMLSGTAEGQLRWLSCDKSARNQPIFICPNGCPEELLFNLYSTQIHNFGNRCILDCRNTERKLFLLTR